MVEVSLSAIFRTEALLDNWIYLSHERSNTNDLREEQIGNLEQEDLDLFLFLTRV